MPLLNQRLEVFAYALLRTSEELCAAFNMRRLADIDADIEACASAEDYSDEEMANRIFAQLFQDLEKLLATAPPKPQVKVVKNFRFPCCLPTTDDEDENLWEDQAELPILLKVQNLGVRFADHVVLEKISFLLRQGEKVAIVGRNGCGKSTLVRALVKDLDTSAAVDGDAAITSAGAAYFPQRLAEAFNSDDGTVKDALYMSCKPDDINRAGGIDAVLDRLRLDGVTQEQPVSSLSGGEKARVAFAQFLLNPVLAK
eukprot:g22479.t1